MTGRQAKRQAYIRAAGVIETALDCGWPDEFYGPEEYQQVVDELIALIAGLRAKADAR